MNKSKKKSAKQRDLEFLYEIGAMRFIDRSWRQFYNPGAQNLSEHHLRVAWLALIIAQREGVKDTGKVVKMALVHDIGESRTGDASWMQKQYVTRDEEHGILDVFKNTSIADEFVSLWREYEEKESLEAKIVKDADNLDVDLELQEREAIGGRLKKEWSDTRIMVYANKLNTKTAKKLWKEIQKSNPHDWHREARNLTAYGKQK